MPTIQELIATEKERFAVFQKNLFDLQEQEKRERDEAYRDKTLKERAVIEEATQLSVFEEVEGMGKEFAEALGVGDIISPDILLGVIAYTWRHPSGGMQITNASMLENLARYRKEHDKQKKKKKS